MPWFRPYPIMTLFSALSLVVLCALGWWQVDRLQWKLDLIAAVEARAASEPRPLLDVLADTPAEEWEYTPVIVSGVFQPEEIHVFGADLDGAPGWFIFRPVELESGQHVMLNWGYVPQELKDLSARGATQPAAAGNATGLLRLPSAGGAFTPLANTESNEWYARDAEAMAVHLGIDHVLPVYVDVTSVEGTSAEWPRPGQTRLEFTNNHLGYALTWFGLALTLIGVYIAFHWQGGRIGRRKN